MTSTAKIQITNRMTIRDVKKKAHDCAGAVDKLHTAVANLHSRRATFAEIRRSRDAVNTYDDAAYRADIGARNEHQRAQLRETQAKANAFYGRTGR